MIDMSSARHLLTAEQATAQLGVSRQTLYSYVSRGLVRALAVPGDPRRSAYDARDVAALVEKRSRGRARRAVAVSTTDWGEPILRSSLTRIADGTFQYRGHDAVTLSAEATLEEVAALLWQQPVASVPEPPDTLPGSVPFERCLRAVAAGASSSDWGTEPTHVAASAARLLGLVVRAACGTARGPTDLMIHERLGFAWGLQEDGTDLVRRALVLCADHELNASAYAARVVASTGASLGACVLAGLSALSGPRHGGMTERVRVLAADPTIRSGARAGRAACQGRGIARLPAPPLPGGRPALRCLALRIPASTPLAGADRGGGAVSWRATNGGCGIGHDGSGFTPAARRRACLVRRG